jgi:hypothetical protein
MHLVSGQKVYTKGHSVHKDGTEFTVSTDFKSGNMVTVVDSLKHVYFIPDNYLRVKDEPKQSTTTVVNTTPVQETKVKIPGGHVKLYMFTAGKEVFVYGTNIVEDGTKLNIIDGYVGNNLTTIQLVDKTMGVVYTVPKDCVYHAYSTTVVTTSYKKPLAKDAKLTDDQKTFVSMLIEPVRQKVIDMVVGGLDLEDYEIYQDKLYFVMVPKDPETLYLPMLMAHTDIQANVNHPTMDNLEFNSTTEMFSSPTGLGADDRAGCYAIHQIIKKHPKKFIVALFDLEEVGCVGSNAFANSEHFEKVNKLASCYISIDRRRDYTGKAHIATYDYDNKELFALVEKVTGRKAVRGSSTDCRVLSAKSYTIPAKDGQSKLACFNMSCGYDKEHTRGEVQYFKELTTVVEDFEALIDLAEDMWDQPFVAEKATYGYQNGYTTTTKTTTTKKPSVKKPVNAYDFDFNMPIMIGDEEYDVADVKTLLYFYRQKTGMDYEFKSASAQCAEFEKYNYVRLKDEILSKGTYGGVFLPDELYKRLVKELWTVKLVDDKAFTVDLEAENSKALASNIPFDWLRVVTIDDPIVEGK